MISEHHVAPPLFRWRTSRRRCSESAASKPETWKSPWEQAPSWTSTPAANHTRLWQVEPGNHVAFSIEGTAFRTVQTDPIEGAPPLQVCIQWWAGRSALRSCTWPRATPQTRAPPSNGRRSSVSRRLFVSWTHLLLMCSRDRLTVCAPCPPLLSPQSCLPTSRTPAPWPTASATRMESVLSRPLAACRYQVCPSVC